MKICLYGRVSTDRQETQNQITQLREFASTQGWKIVREYVDVASGKSSDRQQFKALFAAAAKREFDLVLFWGLDRFSREGVFETLKHLQTLTGYGSDSGATQSSIWTPAAMFQGCRHQHSGSCGKAGASAPVGKNACRLGTREGSRRAWVVVPRWSAMSANFTGSGQPAKA